MIEIGGGRSRVLIMVGVAQRHHGNIADSMRWLLFIGVLTLVFCATVRADTFANVHYDARADEIVATMIYRGTNPNHTFTLKWDKCPAPPEHGKSYEIAAEVLDGQWNDDAVQSFRETVRFSLADLACRPAKVTLRTAPRFLYTIFVPRAPS